MPRRDGEIWYCNLGPIKIECVDARPRTEEKWTIRFLFSSRAKSETIRKCFCETQSHVAIRPHFPNNGFTPSHSATPRRPHSTERVSLHFDLGRSTHYDSEHLSRENYIFELRVRLEREMISNIKRFWLTFLIKNDRREDCLALWFHVKYLRFYLKFTKTLQFLIFGESRNPNLFRIELITYKVFSRILNARKCTKLSMKLRRHHWKKTLAVSPPFVPINGNPVHVRPTRLERERV